MAWTWVQYQHLASIDERGDLLGAFPVRRRPDAGLMTAHRLRRWSNIKTEPGQLTSLVENDLSSTLSISGSLSND